MIRVSPKIGTADGKQLSRSFALRGQMLDHRDVVRRAPNNGKSGERAIESSRSSNRLERGGVVPDGIRQFGSKHHRVGQIDHSTEHEKTVSKRWVRGSLSMAASQKNWPSVR